MKSFDPLKSKVELVGTFSNPHWNVSIELLRMNKWFRQMFNLNNMVTHLCLESSEVSAKRKLFPLLLWRAYAFWLPIQIHKRWSVCDIRVLSCRQSNFIKLHFRTVFLKIMSTSFEDERMQKTKPKKPVFFCKTSRQECVKRVSTSKSDLPFLRRMLMLWWLKFMSKQKMSKPEQWYLKFKRKVLNRYASRFKSHKTQQEILLICKQDPLYTACTTAN